MFRLFSPPKLTTMDLPTTPRRLLPTSPKVNINPHTTSHYVQIKRCTSNSRATIRSRKLQVSHTRYYTLTILSGRLTQQPKRSLTTSTQSPSETRVRIYFQRTFLPHHQRSTRLSREREKSPTLPPPRSISRSRILYGSEREQRYLSARVILN